MLSCPGSFNGGIQRKEVRLAGYLFYDGICSLSLSWQIRSPLRPAPFPRVVGCFQGDFLSLLCVICVLLIFDTISSMDDETSSAEAACSVAPWDISWRWSCSWLPDATLAAAVLISFTTSVTSTHCSEQLHRLVLVGTLFDGNNQVAAGDLLGGTRDLVHRVDEDVQVVLDLIEVPIIGVRDLCRDIRPC